MSGKPRATLIDDAFGVAGDDILDAAVQKHLYNGGAGGAGTAQNELYFFHIFADYFEGVYEGGGDNDSGAVLVVVEDGNVKLRLEPLFDFKAFGRADVLKVDAAEGGGNGFDCGDDFVRVLGGKADGKCVHAAEGFKKGGLSLHHGHSRKTADVAETEDGGAVRDHRHKVAFRGVAVRVLRAFRNGAAGLGDAGRISHGEVVAVFKGHIAAHVELPAVFFVELQRLFIIVHIFNLLVRENS